MSYRRDIVASLVVMLVGEALGLRLAQHKTGNDPWGKYPKAGRINRPYALRTDCGKQAITPNVPLITYSHPGQAGSPDTNAWCELGWQTECAQAIYNRDYMFQAKANDIPPGFSWDFFYCKHNGWLEPEYVALQNDFDGMRAKAAAFCEQPEYVNMGWKTSLTMNDFNAAYNPVQMRGWPTKEEAKFMGAWACAMGDAGCDIAMCGYTFCDKGNGTMGLYSECEGG